MIETSKTNALSTLRALVGVPFFIGRRASATAYPLYKK
ncbi:hypothetical protein US8_01426 [Bacillus altitudinis]|nr:hypothetical protein US8_01426 [Bacillus altitudinis]